MNLKFMIVALLYISLIKELIKEVVLDIYAKETT